MSLVGHFVRVRDDLSEAIKGPVGPFTKWNCAPMSGLAGRIGIIVDVIDEQQYRIHFAIENQPLPQKDSELFVAATASSDGYIWKSGWVRVIDPLDAAIFVDAHMMTELRKKLAAYEDARKTGFRVGSKRARTGGPAEDAQDAARRLLMDNTHVFRHQMADLIHAARRKFHERVAALERDLDAEIHAILVPDGNAY